MLARKGYGVGLAGYVVREALDALSREDDEDDGDRDGRDRNHPELGLDAFLP
jgi:regulatory protein